MAVTQLVQRVLGVAADAGAAALHRLQHLRVPGIGPASATDPPERAAARWHAVTVLRGPEEVDTGRPSAPLADLGERVEVRVRPAPGNRGVELAARLRSVAGDDDIGQLRAALREAKQILEVGEVLRVEPQPHGNRRPTPQGRLLEGAVERSPREGVL